MAPSERVIALLDMDCFYVQVEERDRPAIRGRPAAVVQYNTHLGGGIIAVNYEARAHGVKRGMRGTQAQEICRDIVLVRVPMKREKACLQKYRAASKEVMDVLVSKVPIVERSSIDESYLDLTAEVDRTLKTCLRNIDQFCQVDDLPNTWVEDGGDNPGGDDEIAADALSEEDEAHHENEAHYEEKEAHNEEDENAIQEDETPTGEDEGLHCEDDTNAVLTNTVEELKQDREVVRKMSLSKWMRQLHLKLKSSDFDSLDKESIDDVRLVVAAKILEDIRQAVFEATSFRCSAGIAHNKVLAKLVCGLHKPNQQTVLPSSGVTKLWQNTPIHKVRNLGGNLGQTIKRLYNFEKMIELRGVTERKLLENFDQKTVTWLRNLSLGLHSEAVNHCPIPRSCGCGKNFPGREKLYTLHRVKEWVSRLVEEMVENLTEDSELYKRRATLLSVSVHTVSGSYSRSSPLPLYDCSTLVTIVMGLMCPMNKATAKDLWSPPITQLGLSASKFDSSSANMPSISDMFNRQKMKNRRTSEQLSDTLQQSSSICPISEDTSDSIPSTSVDKSSAAQYSGTSSSRSKSIVTTDDSDSQNSNSFFKNYALRKFGRSAVAENTENSKLKSFTNITAKCDMLLSTGSYEGVRKTDVMEYSDSSKTTSVDDTDENVLNSTDMEFDLDLDDLRYKSDYISVSDEDSSDVKPVVVTNDLEKENSDRHQSDRNSRENDSDENRLDVSKTIPDLFKTLASNKESVSSRVLQNKEEWKSSVDVSEIFPNLDDVDEETLSLLPLDLQKAVNLALQRHRAEKTGIEAIKSSSKMLQYLKKNNGSQSPSNSNSNSLFLDVKNTPKMDAGTRNCQSKVIENIDLSTSDKKSTSPSKKDFTNNSSLLEKKTLSIIENTQNVSHSFAPEDFIRCTKCTKMVGVVHYEEHLDYHVARDVQKEWNQIEMNKVKKRKMDEKPSQGSAKRKSLDAKNKTLDTFFVKK